MEHKTPLSQLNEMIREDLITEGIITGRESKCGSWSNPEMFPRQPYQVKCDSYFCPSCGYEKVEWIRKNVSTFTNDFQRDDGILYLLTLTIPHDQNTDLNVLYKSFSQSVMRMKNSSIWRNRFKKSTCVCKSFAQRGSVGATLFGDIIIYSIRQTVGCTYYSKYKYRCSDKRKKYDFFHANYLWLKVHLRTQANRFYRIGILMHPNVLKGFH